MIPDTNTGKVMTKLVRTFDGTTVVLNFLKPEAAAMRNLVQAIRLKGDKRPSLSLIARRAMQRYMEALRSTPEILAFEVATMDRMVTPVPKPRKATPGLTP